MISFAGVGLWVGIWIHRLHTLQRCTTTFKKRHPTYDTKLDPTVTFSGNVQIMVSLFAFFDFHSMLANSTIWQVIIQLFWKIFTSALVDGFPLEFKGFSLLKSPGLLEVFWSIWIILLFGWSPLALLLTSPPVPLSTLWWLYQAHKLYFALSCSIVFQFFCKV